VVGGTTKKKTRRKSQPSCLLVPEIKTAKPDPKKHAKEEGGGERRKKHHVQSYSRNPVKKRLRTLGQDGGGIKNTGPRKENENRRIIKSARMPDSPFKKGLGLTYLKREKRQQQQGTTTSRLKQEARVRFHLTS